MTNTLNSYNVKTQEQQPLDSFSPQEQVDILKHKLERRSKRLNRRHKSAKALAKSVKNNHESMHAYAATLDSVMSAVLNSNDPTLAMQIGLLIGRNAPEHYDVNRAVDEFTQMPVQWNLGSCCQSNHRD